MELEGNGGNVEMEGTRNGNGGNGHKNRNHGMNYGGFMPVIGECTSKILEVASHIISSGPEGVDSALTWWNSHKRTIGVDAAYAINWAGLMRLQDAVRIANQLMDKKLQGYAARSAENKRRMESNPRDNHGQQPPFKKQNISGQNVARAYTAGNNERKGYVGFLPYCNKCRLHHEGLYTIRCGNCKKVGHLTRDCRVTVTPNTQGTAIGNQQGIGCYECGRPGHFRKDCPKLRS
ncbi:putative reverse transcriptase domain-containing protein [Tanacetum coccineum]